MRRVESGLLRVLISGAGSGIGLACARTFAERGAELILTDIDAPSLDRAARKLGAFAGPCDVCSEESVDAFAADVIQALSSIDVLINAAGRRFIRTLGMVRMTQAFLPAMIGDRTWKDVINIAPMGGFRREPCHFPYAASQEAFDRLSEAQAFEVRGTNVAVTAIVPQTNSNAADHRGCNADRSVPAWTNTYYVERFEPQSVAAQVVAAVQRNRTLPGTAAAVRRFAAEGGNDLRPVAFTRSPAGKRGC